jgi:thiosulfate/3-mercaptopyruvate sulfurtransferase
MTYDTLISVPQLRELLQSGARLVLLDASFDLMDTTAGEKAYGEAHLPDARYVHLDRDLSAAKTGLNGRHPMPTREVFAKTAGAWGIDENTQVVAYDRQGAMYAARVWWMLRWLGHASVALLDGGFQAWQKAGGEVETAVPEVKALPALPLKPSLVPTMDGDTLASSLGKVRLIDARAPERFRGDVEPIDKQAGHIPGALNRFFKDNLDAEGRFKPAGQLRDEWTPLLADGLPVVQQCGSGATACHNIFAMQLAGLGSSTLYPGSWSEWSANPSRPIAKG